MSDSLTQSTAGRTCPRWLRIILSLLVIGHFLAIFFSVTGVSSTSFSGPRLCQAGLAFCQPYLGRLLLDCPYRFYSPDPGVNPCLWIRAHYDNGKSFCMEWPSLTKISPESRFMREMGLVGSLRLGPLPDSGTPPEIGLVEPAATILSSLVRRLSRVVIPEAFPQPDSKLLYLDLYKVSRVQPPPHVLNSRIDLFNAQYHGGNVLGRYDAQGNRLSHLATPNMVVGELIQVMLELDIQPHLHDENGSSIDPSKYAKLWPTAINGLLKSAPELKDLQGRDLSARLERLMSSP